MGAAESPLQSRSLPPDKTDSGPTLSNVTLLFLESPSSRQLLGEWQYFHLTDTSEEPDLVLLSRTFAGKRAGRLKRGEQSEAGSSLPKEEKKVLSNIESANDKTLNAIHQLPGELEELTLPSYEQLCSISEQPTTLPNSVDEFLTAPSSLAVGGSLAQDEDFYSASSSLEMGRLDIVIDSATDITEEEEDTDDEISSTEEKEAEEKLQLATPTFVGRRQLELEEGSVCLSLYSEGALATWAAEGRWGGHLAGVDILGLVSVSLFDYC